MKRAAIYCRISSDREGRALGVQRQEEDCRHLAARMGYETVRIFKDNDTSASRHSKKRRPDFDEMIELAKGGYFEAIVSWSTSRLTRRPLEHELLIPLFEERRIMINTVKAGDHDYTTARGRRRAREDAARDAEEAEETAERIRRQKLQAAMSGEWRGGPRPYGYGLQVGVDERNGKPLLDWNRLVSEEAAVVAWATRQVLDGASLRGLASELNAQGQRTSTGHEWKSRVLRGVLRRARNAGLIEMTGETGELEIVGKAVWPAIVSEEEWRAVVELLGDPARRTNKTNIARRWIGSGLYRCSVCNETMRAGPSARSGGATVYRCHKRTKQDTMHVARRADYVDEYVTKTVLGLLSRPRVAAKLVRRDEPDVTLLRAEAKSLRGRLNEADAMFSAGELDRRRLAKISNDVRTKLSVVENKLAESASMGPLARLLGEDDIATAWAALDVPRQQAIVEALGEVVLYPTKKGRPHGWTPGEKYFDPDTVEIKWRHEG